MYLKPRQFLLIKFNVVLMAMETFKACSSLTWGGTGGGSAPFLEDTSTMGKIGNWYTRPGRKLRKIISQNIIHSKNIWNSMHKPVWKLDGQHKMENTDPEVIWLIFLHISRKESKHILVPLRPYLTISHFDPQNFHLTW